MPAAWPSATPTCSLRQLCGAASPMSIPNPIWRQEPLSSPASVCTVRENTLIPVPASFRPAASLTLTLMKSRPRFCGRAKHTRKTGTRTSPPRPGKWPARPTHTAITGCAPANWQPERRLLPQTPRLILPPPPRQRRKAKPRPGWLPASVCPNTIWEGCHRGWLRMRAGGAAARSGVWASLRMPATNSIVCAMLTRTMP